MDKRIYNDRDLSWLSFNERVLQEAERKETPIMERLKFLAIFSSNLEEFYKVRVARQRNFAFAKINKANKFGYKPTEILKEIYRIVDAQQNRFGQIFRKEILAQLRKKGVKIVTNPEKKTYREDILKLYDQISETVDIIDFTDLNELFLENQSIYLFLILRKKVNRRYFLVKIDTDAHPRFFQIEKENLTYVFYLDDILRIGLNYRKFSSQKIEAYSIKLSRDAELYLEDEPIESNIKDKIVKSIQKRDTGVPSRFLFDELIPYRYLNDIMIKTNSDREALIPGGRYHRFYDFFSFPKINNTALYYPKVELVESSQISQGSNLIDQVLEKDILLCFPYQDYSNIIRLLDEASLDERVEEIKITLYRVAEDSLICQALEKAIQNGKKVTVYTELKARFDESSNLYWNSRLKKSGALIYEDLNDLKTHAKIFQIKLKSGKSISHLGTGNFNENSAKIYTDISLLSSSSKINKDVTSVFDFLTKKTSQIKTQQLLCSPFTLRNSIHDLIDQEVKHKKEGKAAEIILKLNSLEDPEIISHLYKASQQGVKIKLIVRGIFSLRTGIKGLSENIEAISIVGRFLEHSRVYYFKNENTPIIYCSSADMMERNLDKRIEVAFPIMDFNHQQFIRRYLDQQWQDNTNSRILDKDLKNGFKPDAKNRIDCQKQIIHLIREFEL